MPYVVELTDEEVAKFKETFPEKELTEVETETKEIIVGYKVKEE